MGQVCSGRRSKHISPPSISTPTSRPPSTSHAPPPYSTSKSHIITTVAEKEEPELSTHPALRDKTNAIRNGNANGNFTPSQFSTPHPAQLSYIPEQESEQENWNATVSTTTASTVSDPTPNIIPSSLPSYGWTNSQCRHWLALVLITYGNRPSPLAHRLADSFQGWGPNLYLLTWGEWNAWLGADGQAIWALLEEGRGRSGVREKGEGGGKGEGGLDIRVRSRYPLGEGEGTGRVNGKLPGGGGEREAGGSKKQGAGAGEWGKETAKRLDEEREKVRVEREKPVEKSEKSEEPRKRGWFWRRSKVAVKV